MPRFWGFGRSPPQQRKLQDGLFQIASQTCNLLVQVNNTNNISYGDNSTNFHCNSVKTPQTSSSTTNVDEEQLVVLLPPGDKSNKFKPVQRSRSKLSTVLEGRSLSLSHDDDPEVWNQGYLVRRDEDVSPVRRWRSEKSWCRPSCIPISIILILIFLVVLLPLLDQMHPNIHALNTVNNDLVQCSKYCKFHLVESIPEGLIYPNESVTYPSTYDTWLSLINTAERTIEIASLYWTLQSSEVYPHPSSKEGDDIFKALLNKGVQGKIKLKIVQNAPTQNQPNIDTEILVKRKAAEVRSLNFAQLLGGGVLHTKLWIIDRRHVYVGSANMDWRSLTQVKEMGIHVENCTCLAEDIAKIFDVYWILGEKGAKIPDQWPSNLNTFINLSYPMLLNKTISTYISSSPLPFNPKGRTNDIDAVINVIEQAEKFVYIAVMDYFPLMIYTPKVKFWPIIDDALRKVAVEDNVKIRMLVSWWNHSRYSEDFFLKSLQDISHSYPRVQIEVRRFVVPSSAEQSKIPFSRVNHNKYMVTDNTAYIGTSNWSGDYFTDTAGIGFIMSEHHNETNTVYTIRSQLQAVFERDWNSKYSYPA